MPRSRRKLDTSPIEYDDVVDSPALKGMVSFLEVPPGQLPRLDFTGSGTGETGIPPSGRPETGAPQLAGTVATVALEELGPATPETGIPKPGVLETGDPQMGDPYLSHPRSGRPETPIPESGIPQSGVPVVMSPVGGTSPEPASEEGSPEEGPPEPGLPNKAASGTGTPLSGGPRAYQAYPPVLSRPLTRIRRATSAQDGHSFGEQALYEALWQHAHPHGDETRIVTVGYRRMAELARLTVNNCKANIQSLIQKLAVEEVASFTHSQGRTYLIYSYNAILHRRRESGLTHYIKSRGVLFVDPDTGEPLTTRLRDKSGIPFSPAPGSGPPETARIPGGKEQMARIQRGFEAILQDPNSPEEDRRFVRRMLEGN